MNSFLEPAFIKGLDECGVAIKRSFEEIARKAESKVIGELNEEELISRTYISAWTSFESRYKEDPNDLQKKTALNRSLLHDSYVFDISGFNKDRKYFLFVLLRFLFEYYSYYDDSYSTAFYKDYTVIDWLDKVDSWGARNNFSTFYFSWIKTQMPYLMVKHLIGSEDFKKTKNLIVDIDIRKKGIQDELERFRTEATSSVEYVDSLKNEVRILADKFSNAKLEGNFKLLSKGFSTIRKSKSNELIFAHIRTWFFLFLLVLVPLWIIFYHPIGGDSIFKVERVTKGIDLYGIKEMSEFRWASVLFYIPFLTLELLFFYFMRVFYSELKSIRAQLLQIDLRLNLCEFMHDYAETRSKSTTEKNLDSWKSFENLIFSPLQVNDDKIPAVLDGADAIAELAGKIMARKPS